MKKNLLLGAITFLMVGCATTSVNQTSNPEGYKPQVNMFEKKLWISVSDVELFQDETFLYLYISYTSKNAGKYSLFNPPSGDVFKHQGDMAGGSGEILQQIDKDSLNGIEGITALFFPDNYSNESERVGFFINSGEINWRQIPVKPDNLKTQKVPEVSDSSQRDNNTNSDFPSGLPYRNTRNADWFQTRELNFYADQDLIYIHLAYTSDFESTYRLFGDEFSIQGFCSQGEGDVLIPIPKDVWNSSPEIKLSIGYGNEESQESFLLNKTALAYENLSQKPDSLIVDENDIIGDDEDWPWSSDIIPWRSTIDDVIVFMGREPDIYLWGDQRYAKDNLPEGPYLMRYLKENGDADISYLALGQEENKIAEIRIHSDKWDFYTIKIGQTLDEVFEILGHPKKTVIDEEISYNHLVLNKDIDGEPGHYHIHHRSMGVGVFFKEEVVHDIFIFARGISK